VGLKILLPFNLIFTFLTGSYIRASIQPFMKKILLSLLLLPSLSFAQGLFTVSGTTTFTDLLGPGFGAELSGGGRIAKPLYASVSIGATKFANLDKAYVPFMANILFITTTDQKAVVPYLQFGYGYGGYSDAKKTGNPNLTTTGGRIVQGTLGVMIPTGGKLRPNVSVGYTSTSLKVPVTSLSNSGNTIIRKEQKSYPGISVKVGLAILNSN
jgi:hypothetical protein